MEDIHIYIEKSEKVKNLTREEGCSGHCFIQPPALRFVYHYTQIVVKGFFEPAVTTRRRNVATYPRSERPFKNRR